MVTTASGDATAPAVTSTPSSVPVRPNESSPTRSSQVRPGPSRGLRPAALWTIQAGWTASPGCGAGPKRAPQARSSRSTGASARPASVSS